MKDMVKIGFVTMLMALAIAGCRKEKAPQQREEQSVQQAVNKPLVVFVTNLNEWEKVKNDSIVKIVAFVSSRLSGKEQEDFLAAFQRVAKSYRNRALFVYINCDQDNLWQVYDALNANRFHAIPLVVSLTPSNKVISTHVNPPGTVMMAMVDMALAVERASMEFTDSTANKTKKRQ